MDQKFVDRVTTLESQVEELQAGQGIQPTADEWDVPCYNNLPCSFVSKRGPGVITITDIAAHCNRMKADPDTSIASETTTSSVYWRKAQEKTTRKDTLYNVLPQAEIEDVEDAVRVTVDDPVTCDWYNYELVNHYYETTIQIKGYVSEEFLAGEHTKLQVYMSSGTPGFYFGGFDITVNEDGTFFEKKTLPYRFSYFEIHSIESYDSESYEYFH